MKIIVLGGFGLQGKAALVDLARSRDVDEIVCADQGPDRLQGLRAQKGMDKVRTVNIDCSSREALASLLGQGFDAAIDLLPLPLMSGAFEAAIQTRTPLVSTNYASTLGHLDGPAREAGVALLPECGLDPGIDLVLIGHGVRQFDRLEILNSYCGGIPEPQAVDNPLKYKISWNWDMVLTSQKRPSLAIRDGKRIEVSVEEQHESDLIHTINFPGLGDLEALPNGNAVKYTDLLNLTSHIKNTGRYSLRWPGWCAFWAPLKRLGFLDETPVPGLPGQVSPKQFMARHLEPKLQYGEKEKDLAVMYNYFEGIKDGRRKAVANYLLIERDLATGLLAMSLGVGYTASIAAQMIAGGLIKQTGLLSPAAHVPYEPFLKALSDRGIMVRTEESWVD
ncbi:MAG: saccharopine dehydrogenase C-terminal domain-containing protein [Pseudomonadota bacterium]